MKIQFTNKEFEVKLLDGEYRRYIEDDKMQSGEYLCIGLYRGNKILFQYIDTTGEIVDYVQDIIDNIPEFALDYLTNVIDKNINVLIRLIFTPELPTSFEIYYDCYCESDNMDDIIKWMDENNDFAAIDFRYTEIINGHQKCIGE